MNEQGSSSAGDRPAGQIAGGDGSPAVPPVEATRLPADVLASILRAARADDAARHPDRTPLHWRVLLDAGAGERALLELVDRPWGTRWLHPEAPLRLRSCARDTAITLPGSIADYPALLIVEYDATEPDHDPRRLLAAGQACWRRATAAGLDAVLVSASGGTGASAACPVVAVGVSLTPA